MLTRDEGSVRVDYLKQCRLLRMINEYSCAAVVLDAVGTLVQLHRRLMNEGNNNSRDSNNNRDRPAIRRGMNKRDKRDKRDETREKMKRNEKRQERQKTGARPPRWQKPRIDSCRSRTYCEGLARSC